MTDETPSADEPTSTEPTPEPAATAPEPAAEPAAPAPAAATPEPATAAEPTPAEPPTAEAVTPPTVAAAAPAAESTAVPVATAAAPPPERRGGIFLPTWLAALLAVLLIGGLGFVIGYASGDDDDSNPSIAANSQPNLPNRGNLPNGGNGRNLPGYPGNGNGPNGNGSGNSNGETNASAAFLGVSVENADNDGGANITAVRSDSPASEAGLKEGDVITKVGDTDVKSAADLIGAIRSHDPGDDVTVTYTRDGSSAQVTVHLGDRSDIARSSLPS